MSPPHLRRLFRPPGTDVFVSVEGESERFGRNVYCGFEVNSGDFAVIYEWSLQWSKKMSKFFTTQEKGKIENCKKQASIIIIKNLLPK